MSIKEKIAAIIAKAKGTDNEHEAEAFLAKANEMLERYQLSVHDIMPDDDKVISFNGRDWSSTSHNWFWDLYHAVAAYYGCDTVREQSSILKTNGRAQTRYQYVLIGRQSAIETTELMYPYLFAEVNRQARIIAKLTGMTPAGQANRVGAALVSRIWQMIPKKENARTEVVEHHALMTMSSVEALVKQLYPELHDSKKGRRTSDSLSRAEVGS